MKKSYLIYSILLVSVLLFGCTKNKKVDDPKNTAPMDNTTAENVFNAVFKTIHQTAVDNSILTDSTSGAVANSKDNCIDSVYYAYFTPTFPNTIVIDYGTESSSCTDGYTKKGKIKAAFSGKYSTQNTSIAVSFSNLYFDEMKISGTMTIKNTGKNSKGENTYSMLIANAFMVNDSTNIEWNGSKSITWTGGTTTATASDDVFEISGTANGRATKGNKFSVSTDENLSIDMSCKWINKGKVSIDLGNAAIIRSVDYGTGSCDKNATVSFQRTTYVLDMR